MKFHHLCLIAGFLAAFAISSANAQYLGPQIGGPSTGAAGGGLKGSYPNPSLADVNSIGTSLAIGGCTIGTDVLCWTGTATGSSLTVTTAFTATGLVVNSDLATMVTNTIKGNATSGTASPTDLAIGSCSTASSALIWTTNTGFGCNISITANAVPAANLTGTTLASGVVTSSLTTVGTIGTGIWQGTAVTAGFGGTGQSTYAVGDILYASASTTLSKLSDVATGNALISGGVTTAPSWGKITSSHLNITTTTCTNQFLTAISATGTGTCTTVTLAGAQFANQGTTTTVLHGNASGNPSWAAVALGSDVSGTLPIANGGTNDTGTSWTASSPTATCGVGSPTTITTAWRQKTLGKTVWYNAAITLTTINTCTGALVISLGGATTSGAGAGSAYNTTSTVSKNLTFGNAATGISIVGISGAFPGVNGDVINIGGVYEAQ